jgi:hypothetical protein
VSRTKGRRCIYSNPNSTNDRLSQNLHRYPAVIVVTTSYFYSMSVPMSSVNRRATILGGTSLAIKRAS